MVSGERARGHLTGIPAHISRLMCKKQTDVACSAASRSRTVMTTISKPTPLCLGSASPRRWELLTGLGLPLRIQAADVQEDPFDGEPPSEYLQRVVDDKLAAVRSILGALDDAAAILVADTIVVVENDILGKPVDVEDAARLLRRISGREHIVYTRY